MSSLRAQRRERILQDIDTCISEIRWWNEHATLTKSEKQVDYYTAQLHIARAELAIEDRKAAV